MMHEIPLQSSLERSPVRGSRVPIFASLFGVIGLCFGVGVVAYHLGTQQPRLHSLKDAVLHATATHGGENLAVATGQVGDESEGIFILDFITGNLQCWVYNARFRQFGAKFETNIMREFPAAKGSELLMVTGAVSPQQATSNNARPAGCVVYVIDPRSGMFAGYTFPWNRQGEIQGQAQGGPMFCVGGDLFRAPSGGGAAKKPESTAPDAKEKSKKATAK